LAQAINYHPFGLVIVPTLWGLGILAFLPSRWRDRVRMVVVARARLVWRASLIILWCLFVGGLFRAVAVYFGWLPFPFNWF
jgi:hypothetical protein